MLRFGKGEGQPTPPRKPPMVIPDSPRPTAAQLAMDVPEATLEELASKQAQHDEVIEEARDQARDMALWAETLPDSTTQAKYFGNLRNRMLKGISRKRIEEMSIRDRIASANTLNEMRRLEMDQPTQNISFSDRFELAGALPKLLEEVERRKREANTIDVTTNGGDET